MADFEDSNSPTWHNIVDGQVNLLDANNGTIEFKNPDGELNTLIFLYNNWPEIGSEIKQLQWGECVANKKILHHAPNLGQNLNHC